MVGGHYVTERFRCVCKANVDDPTRLRKPQIRTARRHCSTSSTDVHCSAASMSTSISACLSLVELGQVLEYSSYLRVKLDLSKCCLESSRPTHLEYCLVAGGQVTESRQVDINCHLFLLLVRNFMTSPTTNKLVTRHP